MMTQATPTTLRVTNCSLSDIQDKVKKLNRRAKRLNLPDIVLTFSNSAPLVIFRSETKKVVLEIDDPVAEQLRSDSRYKQAIVETVNITIVGQAPKLNGWRLVATLEPTEDGEGGFVNIVKAVIGEDVDKSYRSAIGRCDHCNKNRRRKETFVVAHDDGNQKVVGRNCIADFLGHQDINALANYAAQLAEFGNSLGDSDAVSVVSDEDHYGGGTYEAAFPVQEFVEMSVRACRVFGWMSASAAQLSYDSVCSTKSIVLDHMERPTGMSQENITLWERTHAQLLDANVGTDPADIVEWAKSIDRDEDNDYLFNLRTIAHVGYVTTKTAGYAASMYVAYQKAQEREIERQEKAARPPSQHVGVVGERMELTVTVERIFEFEGEYGCVGIHKMVDSNGNDLVWFASGSNWLDDEDAVAYKIKGTVKKHDEYQGRPQTALNRVKIIETITE